MAYYYFVERWFPYHYLAGECSRRFAHWYVGCLGREGWPSFPGVVAIFANRFLWRLYYFFYLFSGGGAFVPDRPDQSRSAVYGGQSPVVFGGCGGRTNVGQVIHPVLCLSFC